MSDFNRFIILFLCILPIAGIAMYFSPMEPINLEAQGTVVEARWNTYNHNIFLFLIRKGTGTPKKLHHVRVTLKPEQIKVGGSFTKNSGSNMCTINGVEIRCVD